MIRSLLSRDNCVVLKLQGLHAKVVIGTSGAVVSSANMSTNGLGAEGADASGSIEAGYFVSARHVDHEKIVAWFEEVWAVANEITEFDLVTAQHKYNTRNGDVSTSILTETSPEPLLNKVDPYSLVTESFSKNYRLRAVKPHVLRKLKSVHPDIDPRRLGKIATWTCHLILNRAGVPLDFYGLGSQGSGQATDQWILSRFGKDRSREMNVEAVCISLRGISRDTDFPINVRSTANALLSMPPW